MSRNRLIKDSYREAWHQIELPISKKTVQIKSIKMKENKAFAQIIEEAQEKDDVKLFLAGTINIIASCTKDCTPKMILKLNVADFTYLSNKITSITKGDKSKYNISCEDKCYKPNPDSNNSVPYVNIVEIDIDESEIENIENINKIISIEALDSKYDIYMKNFTVEMLLNHPELLKSSETFDDIFNIIISFVDFITVDGEKYDDLTKTEIEELFLNFTSYQTYYFGEYIRELPRLILKKKFVCENCKKEQVAEIKDLSNFLE